jgi:hypothetical protein
LNFEYKGEKMNLRKFAKFYFEVIPILDIFIKEKKLIRIPADKNDNEKNFKGFGNIISDKKGNVICRVDFEL